MAFDVLHRIRHSTPLPIARRKTLAALLDFGACANAMFDTKAYSCKEMKLTRQILNEAGLNSSVEEFVRRLSEIEGARPWRLDGGRSYEGRLYREAVVRLYLGMVASTATGTDCLDEGIRGTHCDENLIILFRIVMQCQIIDDVLDYAKDRSAGLPGFLTASESFPEAIGMTRQAACAYANHRDLSRSGMVFPLRIALCIVSTCAKLALRVAL